MPSLQAHDKIRIMKDLFERFISMFRKDPAPVEEGLEEQEPSFSRSEKKRAKKFSKNPFLRFWRRYQLTKIVLILGLGFSLVVGGYLFFVAKSTNVKDLENALKATTMIYDKDGQRQGLCLDKRGPMWN